MKLEKAILAVITTNVDKISNGMPAFICKSKAEMEFTAANLEAILDGIAHGIGDDLYIIVKH